VDSNHQVFSSDSQLGGITIRDAQMSFRRPSFISMDPPLHDEQRRAVSPIVAPTNLVNLEKLIRERSQTILDSLPIGEEFNWVEKVSIELTTQMLATLFDFPFEDRHLLTYWSDIATADLLSGKVSSEEERNEILQQCVKYMRKLSKQRENGPPRFDLLSMMARDPSTRDMDDKMFLGNCILLIVGGNDTTRNSISGGLLALNRYPEQYDKLRANPALIETMVPEIVRWQTPLAHMRRTALADHEVAGQTIRKGDKVVMWYISGNRDEEMIENADDFIIDRKRPRQHLSFGFGIHRCVGNRLAEMQLKILWEEIMLRFPEIRVVGPVKRVFSNFVHGIEEVPVVIPARN
jgi:cytochrome P450